MGLEDLRAGLVNALCRVSLANKEAQRLRTLREATAEWLTSSQRRGTDPATILRGIQEILLEDALDILEVTPAVTQLDSPSSQGTSAGRRASSQCSSGAASGSFRMTSGKALLLTSQRRPTDLDRRPDQRSGVAMKILAAPAAQSVTRHAPHVFRCGCQGMLPLGAHVQVFCPAGVTAAFACALIISQS